MRRQAGASIVLTAKTKGSSGFGDIGSLFIFCTCPFCLRYMLRAYTTYKLDSPEKSLDPENAIIGETACFTSFHDRQINWKQECWRFNFYARQTK